MFEAIGLFVLGLVLLALGGDSIVKGTSGLAQRLGVSPFVAGLLLVAFGTSLPELAVNARAVFTGNPALALGNAVGSNIANVGLTLGARSEEHTSELQSLMRNSYAVFCLKKKTTV